MAHYNTCLRLFYGKYIFVYDDAHPHIKLHHCAEFPANVSELCKLVKAEVEAEGC